MASLLSSGMLTRSDSCCELNPHLSSAFYFPATSSLVRLRTSLCEVSTTAALSVVLTEHISARALGAQRMLTPPHKSRIRGSWRRLPMSLRRILPPQFSKQRPPTQTSARASAMRESDAAMRSLNGEPASATCSTFHSMASPVTRCIYGSAVGSFKGA